MTTKEHLPSVITGCWIKTRAREDDLPPMFDFSDYGDGRCRVHLDRYAIIPVEEFSSLQRRARLGVRGWWSRVRERFSSRREFVSSRRQTCIHGGSKVESTHNQKEE